MMSFSIYRYDVMLLFICMMYITIYRYDVILLFTGISFRLLCNFSNSNVLIKMYCLYRVHV